jgi:hypothetical protein
VTGKKALKTFKEKNSRFEYWVPRGLHEFFLDYLQHYCQGNTHKDRLIVFLYELKSLEDRGITIMNPIRDYEKERRNYLKVSFGTDQLENICIRQIDFSKSTQKDRDVMCGYCKAKYPDQAKACRELRADFKKQEQKEGLANT